MEFPPVMNLVNATFDELNNRGGLETKTVSPQAPQPVGNDSGLAEQNAGQDTATDSGSVGNLLNEKA